MAKIPFRTWYMLFSDDDYSRFGISVSKSRTIYGWIAGLLGLFLMFLLFGILAIVIIYTIKIKESYYLLHNLLLLALSVYGMARTVYLIKREC